VRQQPDPLARDPGRAHLVLDLPRHRDEAVRVPKQPVPRGDRVADRRPQKTALPGLAPGKRLAAQLAVDLRLKHDRPLARARGQEPGQAEHARPAHHEHVVPRELAMRRAKCSGQHAVLAGPRRPWRAYTQHPQAVERLLGRPRGVRTPRHDRCAVAGPHERRAKPADVRLTAPERRMERLGEEEDARQRAFGAPGPPRAGRRSWTT
jgi:hypothetical protein